MGHSSNEFSTQNICSPKQKIHNAYRKIRNFSNENFFHPLSLWKIFFIQSKNFLYLTQKKNFFPKRKYLQLAQYSLLDFSPKQRKIYTYPKIANSQTKKFSCAYPNNEIFQVKKISYASLLPCKNNFPNNKFLILVWKTNFLCLQKKKIFFLDVLFFILFLYAAWVYQNLQPLAPSLFYVE